MQKIKRFFQLVVDAIKKWNLDKCKIIAAALAYYSGVAMAPSLIVIVVIVSFIISDSSVQVLIRDEVVSAVGEIGGEFVDAVLADGFDAQAGVVALGVSLAVLLVSASSLFAQLQEAFDVIWGIPPNSKKGIQGFLIKRLRALGMVLVIGLLLSVTVITSAFVATVTELLEQSPDILASIFPRGDSDVISAQLLRFLPIGDYVASLLILTFVFTWLFWRVPRTSLKIRDVFGAAVFTTILFFIGKALLAKYFTSDTFVSAYGVAGSLLVLLLWIYYSSQIFLLGAQYSYVYTYRYGSLCPELPGRREPDNLPTEK